MTDDERKDDLAGQVPCEECDALNPTDAAFCGECGIKIVRRKAAATEDETPAPPKPRRRRGGRSPDAVEKAHQRQEFGRIKNIVFTVRSVYWANAVLSAVQVLMWHTVLAKFIVETLDALYLPLTLLVYGQVVLMIVGALLVLRAPLIWTTVGACYWTLTTVLAWLNAPFSAYVVCMTFLLLAFWFAVAQAARVQRLLADNPELKIVRDKFDRNRRVEGGVGESLRSRRRYENRQAWGGRLKIGGIVAGLIALLVVVIWWVNLPPAVDDTIRRFETCWHKGDGPGIEKMFTRRGLTEATEFREDLMRRGWDKRGPELGEAELEIPDADQLPAGVVIARATWSTSEGEVRATFQLVDKQWIVAGTRLPALEPTDIEPAIEAFRQAWAAKGSDALVELVRPERRDRLGPMLRNLFRRRDWLETRPRLGDADPGRWSSGRCGVTFDVGRDEVFVRFEYWHPSWRVTGLSLR